MLHEIFSSLAVLGGLSGFFYLSYDLGIRSARKNLSYMIKDLEKVREVSDKNTAEIDDILYMSYLKHNELSELLKFKSPEIKSN